MAALDLARLGSQVGYRASGRARQTYLAAGIRVVTVPVEIVLPIWLASLSRGFLTDSFTPGSVLAQGLADMPIIGAEPWFGALGMALAVMIAAGWLGTYVGFIAPKKGLRVVTLYAAAMWLSYIAAAFVLAGSSTAAPVWLSLAGLAFWNAQHVQTYSGNGHRPWKSSSG